MYDAETLARFIRANAVQEETSTHVAVSFSEESAALLLNMAEAVLAFKVSARKSRVLGSCFPVRARSEAHGARVEIIDGAGARLARLINFDGAYSTLTALSDLRTAIDDANTFNASLDAPRALEAGGRGV